MIRTGIRQDGQGKWTLWAQGTETRLRHIRDEEAARDALDVVRASIAATGGPDPRGQALAFDRWVKTHGWRGPEAWRAMLPAAPSPADGRAKCASPEAAHVHRRAS